MIPAENYVDQPYIVQTEDGAWLCVLTTGVGVEGQAGQHVVTQRSTDLGQSWHDRADVEPADGPEASYAVLVKAGQRLYCFYNHNTDNVRAVRGEAGEPFSRVDSLGHFVFKFSDDHGRSWSSERYHVPVRDFAIDRHNNTGGKARFFWNVGRPLVVGNDVYLTLHKVAAFGEGFYAQSEGAILRSGNLLTERDPERIAFETLPDGDVGLRTPAGGGRVAEEQSISRLSDGSLYCVYRTIDGWPVCTYSRDGGHTWDAPQYQTYGPGGRRMKHPRAATFAWNCGNGQFLYWFHNHGGSAIHRQPEVWHPYTGRNPAWLCAGREINTPRGKILEWSEPEILLYDDDPLVRMSYPDLIEQDRRFFISETQKTVARLHEIDATLLDGLFGQWDNGAVARQGIVLETANDRGLFGGLAMPRFAKLRHASALDASPRGGATIELWLRFDHLGPHQIVLDARDAAGQGILIDVSPDRAIRITINDGRERTQWEADRESLAVGRVQHVAIVIDNGPRTICFVIDGKLCDGGDHREYGWGRYSPTLATLNGGATARLASAMTGLLLAVRIYDRALRTSEIVGNHHAGRPTSAKFFPSPPSESAGTVRAAAESAV